MRVTAVGVVTDTVVCTALVSVQPGTPTGDAVTLTTKPVAGHVALAALEQVTVTLPPEGTEEMQMTTSRQPDDRVTEHHNRLDCWLLGGVQDMWVKAHPCHNLATFLAQTFTLQTTGCVPWHR
jgi:hypothetical protein